MAQFPMGGFFNRPMQSSNHHGRQFQRFPQGQMPMQGYGPTIQNPHYPQQNVPRGTFPPNFGPSRTMQPYPPANMPQMAPPMQQMPQMPPIHLLNPTNDPNVRFEPAPSGMVPPGANPEQALQAPQPPSSLENSADIIIKLSNLTQGESNSITFYDNMAKVSGATAKERELVAELLGNKRQQMESVAGLYRNLTNSEWSAAKDIRVEEARNFRTDIAYALLQESRLLREASQIYASLNDAMHQRVMNSVVYNKIADIAHLMSIQQL
jgi:hypothetical protein